MMNELQQTEFELLKIFVDLCNRLQLKYFLVCGSALGAAKYQGFIPWDDDIDVALPRKDYEAFLTKAPALLPDWVFLQNYKTEKNLVHGFSKLRNCNTTYIEKVVAHLPINHGVYIDVFPLDGYPKNKLKQKIFEWKKRILNWKRFSALKIGIEPKVARRNKILRFLGYDKRTQQAVEKLDKMISGYPTEGSDIWCNHYNWQGKLEYAPVWQYGNGTHAKFEGLDVIIPEKFDEYLTQKYADWRADLPEEEKVGHHFYTVCDCKKPYTAYVNTK